MAIPMTATRKKNEHKRSNNRREENRKKENKNDDSRWDGKNDLKKLFRLGRQQYKKNRKICQGWCCNGFCLGHVCRLCYKTFNRTPMLTVSTLLHRAQIIRLARFSLFLPLSLSLALTLHSIELKQRAYLASNVGSFGVFSLFVCVNGELCYNIESMRCMQHARKGKRNKTPKWIGIDGVYHNQTATPDWFDSDGDMHKWRGNHINGWKPNSLVTLCANGVYDNSDKWQQITSQVFFDCEIERLNSIANWIYFGPTYMVGAIWHEA